MRPIYILLLPACSEPVPPLPPEAITVRTSIDGLAEGFDWAKNQALSYAHDVGDPVGPWYQAALPGREAFAMRDVSHQALGAHFLGLDEHTRNMLFRFARSISDEKDWRAKFAGRHAELDYDGRRLRATQATDIIGNPVSWVDVSIFPEESVTISVIDTD